MKTFRAFLSLILSLLLMLCLLNGCSSDEGYVLYFELDEQPSTLDPQLASGTAEELLVRNLFEGLTRMDMNGAVTNGAAESHTVSEDGLIYTFTISPQAVWSNGDPLTAQDFVFALTRAVDPKTAAPNAAALYCIENAEKINTGKQTGGLGVKALGERQLEIRLLEKNPDFLQQLTSAICMPCHQQTFEKAKGKYGLDAEHFLSNGSFRLRTWNKEKSFSLRINRNEQYAGKFPAEASAVIFSQGDANGRAARIENASLDLGFVNPAEVSDQAGKFLFEKTCYALVVNKASPIGKEKFRRALETSIHRNRLKNELPDGFTVSDTLLPNAVTLSDKPLSAQCSVTPPAEYNPTAAHELFLQGVKADADPGAFSILYYGDEAVVQMAGLLAESFQQALGAVVNITSAESQSALFSTVQNGNYTLALVPITAQSESPKQFLSKFTANSTENIFGFNSRKYDAQVKKITATSDAAAVIKATQTALNLLAGDHSVIPLASSSEALAYSTTYSCPKASPFHGVIDLALIRRNK